VFQELGTPGALPTWDKAAIQQMLQGLSGYQDVPRLASDVEEVVREIRSLQPKVDSLGMRKFMYHLCLWRRPAASACTARACTVRAFTARDCTKRACFLLRAQ